MGEEEAGLQGMGMTRSAVSVTREVAEVASHREVTQGGDTGR